MIDFEVLKIETVTWLDETFDMEISVDQMEHIVTYYVIDGRMKTMFQYKNLTQNEIGQMEAALKNYLKGFKEYRVKMIVEGWFE